MATTPPVAGQAQCIYLMDSYRFVWPDVEIVCDRLQEHKGQLHCEMSIQLKHPFPSLLRQAQFNLSATRTRVEWANYLNGRTSDFDWTSYVEQVCVLCIRRWREGAPLVDLGDGELADADQFLLWPYVVEGAVASGVFGDGGTGKSLLALTVALSVATGEPLLGEYPSKMGPVLFMDWEWDEHEHRRRLRALANAYEVDVPKGMMFYQHQDATLVQVAPSLRRTVTQEGMVLGIVDSLGWARGGEPESAGLTIDTFKAMRTLGIPTFFDDHVTQHDKQRNSPFGSIYTRNASRQLWRLDDSSNGVTGPKHLGLVHCKPNLGSFAARGLLLTVESDDRRQMTKARFDPAEAPLAATLYKAGGRKNAITKLLYENEVGMTVADMVTAFEAEGIKVGHAALKTTLNRHKDLFESFYEDKEVKWRLNVRES